MFSRPNPVYPGTVPLRLPMFALLLAAACARPSPKDSEAPVEDTGDVEGDDDTGVGEPFDECAPVLGEELSVRSLGSIWNWSRNYEAEVRAFEIWETLDDFSSFWSSSGLVAEHAPPEVDFATEQAVGVVLTDRGCFTAAYVSVTGFHTSNLDSADMVAALSVEALNCDGTCDTEGGDKLFLWATPRRPIVTCEAGTRCP